LLSRNQIRAAHRTLATIKAELATIKTDVRSGTREDAIEYACGANATHGLPRKSQDKRNAVMRLVTLPKWENRTQEDIAKQCGVTQPYVSKILKELNYNCYNLDANQPVEPNETDDRVGNSPSLEERRDTVKKFFEDFPGSQELSDREIAKRCGVSEGLVRKVKKELAEEKQRVEQECR
jgi:DNA-directed RNA polymerase specialized sigma subunit